MSNKIDRTIIENTIYSNNRQIAQFTSQINEMNKSMEKYVALEASLQEIIGKLEQTNKYNGEGKEFLRSGFSGVKATSIIRSINATTESIEAIIAELRQILENTTLEKEELNAQAEKIRLQINSLQRSTNSMNYELNKLRPGNNRTNKFSKIGEEGKNCRYR